jgi:phosphoglycolate phosphatase-like HAD superfamily hydrolase
VAQAVIVLWDIDNTLLYTGGAGSIAMTRAFHDLYGVTDAFGRVEFSGRSDSAILLDAMRVHRVTEDPTAEIARFIDAYLPHIERALLETRGSLMPGIFDLLPALAAHGNVVQGLGTGNFRRAGAAKLKHYGIADYFPGTVGGFGDDHADRHELVRIGIDRLMNGTADARVVVIGDTPHDVSAAHANGAFALAVATGRDSVEDLTACGADVALENLAAVDLVLEIVLGKT